MDEEIVIEGINKDYIWYKGSILRTRILSILQDLDRIVKTVEERHEEQLLMIKAVQAENSILRVKLNKLNDILKMKMQKI
jgi:hypothetical protein